MHVDIHDHAEDDLERLWRLDPAAAAAIVVVLEELQGNPSLADKLDTHGDANVGVHLLNVKRWQKAKSAGAPIWRFRTLNTPATSYRVVYAHHWQTKQFCVLAIVHKDEFDYELDSDIGKRILADWRAI